MGIISNAGSTAKGVTDNAGMTAGGVLRNRMPRARE